MAVTRIEPKARAGLDAETLRLMYRHMLRSRLLDERLWVLNRQGRAPFWISAEGHEAVQVAFGMNLKPKYDWVAPYYRDLALTLVLGMTPKDHILSVLQRADDPNSGGRQMPAHYGCRRLNIISTGSSVGTQLIHVDRRGWHQ
jgi:2-oxoisovalerate dehydrogenase E1 component alpha subunit